MDVALYGAEKPYRTSINKLLKLYAKIFSCDVLGIIILVITLSFKINVVRGKEAD
jgi:hypothetical protein